MSEVTLELVQARQAELAKLIEQLTRAPLTLSVPAIDIALQPGEHYAGAVLDDQGHVKHHLVLLAARPDTALDWQAAMDWAKEAGGQLPSRPIAALLYANARETIDPDWYWTDETQGSSGAWYCHFGSGYQGYSSRSCEGCAVAVRLIPLAA